MTGKSIEIDNHLLKKIAYIYISLPLFIFLLGFLKLVIGIPVSILLLFALYNTCFKKSGEEEVSVVADSKTLCTVLGFSSIWVWLSGIGGFFYQNLDFAMRNAIFRDLISYNWPVQYHESNYALVYYVGYWLPSALVAKLFGVFNLSADTLFLIGNVALFFYSVIGIALVMLYLLKVLKVQTYARVLACMLILIFFSGLDIVGSLFTIPPSGHLEWWMSPWQYSSFTTVLFWAFNQGIIAWLVTLIFLDEQKVENFGLLGVCCLFCASFPFLGLLVFFLGVALRDFVVAIKQKQYQNFFKKVFSIQNCVSILFVLPLIVLYLNSNLSVSGQTLGIHEKIAFSFLVNDYWAILQILLFLFLEVGIYLILISRFYKKNLIFHVAVLSLLIIPFLNYISMDFCMRASIPALVVLMVLVINYLFSVKNWKKDINAILIILVLLLGAVNPVIEFRRGIKAVVKNKRFDVVYNPVKTLQSRPDNFVQYFVSMRPDETIFFKFLAR